MGVKVTSYVKQAIKANSAGVDKGMQIIAIDVTTLVKKNLTSMKAVDTGQLRNSYLWKKIKNGYRVGSAVLHAIYIEFGTRFMAARPAFRLAIALVMRGPKAAEAMKKSMVNSVKRATPK